MKIEDLKVGRVYRAKRPRGVHRLDGSYVNDRQILYISPFGESIQYDSPSVTFKAKYPIISTEKFLKWADKDITDSLPPITCGITNPEEHYITCEKKNYRGDVIKTFKAFDLPTELITMCFEIKSTVSDFKSPNGHNLVGDVNYYVVPSDTFKQLEKLGLVDEVPPHIGFITAHEGRYSKLRLITKKAATKVTPAVDKYMLAWSAVKGRYINSSVSNKKVNSAAIVECKGFKVRERQI